jgi:alpha-mannosidase
MTNCNQLYAKVFETGEQILKELHETLGVQAVENPKTKERLAALNTMPWHRREIISLGNGQAGVACGEGNLLNIKTFKIAETPEVTVKEVKDGVFVLQNDQLRVEVDGGCITSLYDRVAEREVIPKAGKANQFVIFDDKPLYWQAWDVEVFHLDSRKVLSSGATKVVQSDAHQVSVMTETKISDKSWVKTYISLSAAFKGQQSYVEMHSEVEWREDKKFLKVEFPVDVRNTEASYETQFGIVRRPTHYNTT